MGRKPRDVSPFVSGAGLVAGVWTDLDAAVRKLGGTDADIYRLATPEGKDTIAKMAEIVLAHKQKDMPASAAVQPPAPVVVDVSKFFTPLSDVKATTLLAKVYGSDEAVRIVRECRRLATDEGYMGHIFWRIAAGFDWRKHGPLFGTCREQWAYLQSWRLEKDAVTIDSLAFFIPRLLAGSTGKSVPDQRKLLVATRGKYNLPTPFLADFGSAANVSGLVLSYHRLTRERTPFDLLWARCETVREDGDRLRFGDFHETYGLRCDFWNDGGPGSNVGFFPLGVVPLGH